MATVTIDTWLSTGGMGGGWRGFSVMLPHFITFSWFIWGKIHRSWYACKGQRATMRTHSLLLPCWSWQSNLSHQSCQQVPLLTGSQQCFQYLLIHSISVGWHPSPLGWHPSPWKSALMYICVTYVCLGSRRGNLGSRCPAWTTPAITFVQGCSFTLPSSILNFSLKLSLL